MENLSAKILIIDDQQANVDVLEQLLELNGYENVKSVTNSEHAEETIDNYNPDLILLDLMMPVVSGFDLLAILQAKGQINNLMPIIVLTADSTIESKKKALTMGASDFVTKPFDITEVSLRIKNQLRNVYLLKELNNQKSTLETTVEERTKELKMLFSELESAYNELEFQKTKYQIVADNTYNWEFWEDPNGKMIYHSPSVKNVTGYTENEFMDHDCSLLQTIIHPDDIQGFANHRDAVFNHHGPGKHEFRIITKSGELKYIEHFCMPVYDAKKTFLGIRGTNVDVTERTKYIAIIEEQNKSLKDIAWTQSHVLRAPVARMMGIINLLQSKTTADFSTEEMLEQVNHSAHEIDTIVRDITQKTAIVNKIEKERLDVQQDKKAAKLEVLLIDDDNIANMINKIQVVNSGIHKEPKIFSNALDALDEIDKNRNEKLEYLILLDINMPVMNGWQFLDAIMAKQLHNNISVAMVTSSIDMEDRVKASQYAIVVDFLSKPITLNALSTLRMNPKIHNLYIQTRMVPV